MVRASHSDLRTGPSGGRVISRVRRESRPLRGMPWQNITALPGLPRSPVLGHGPALHGYVLSQRPKPASKLRCYASAGNAFRFARSKARSEGSPSPLRIAKRLRFGAFFSRSLRRRSRSAVEACPCRASCNPQEGRNPTQPGHASPKMHRREDAPQTGPFFDRTEGDTGIGPITSGFERFFDHGSEIKHRC